MSAVVTPRKLSTLNVEEVHLVLHNLNIDISKEILASSRIDGELLSLAENADELVELNVKLPALKMKLLLKKIVDLKEEGVPDSILGKRHLENSTVPSTPESSPQKTNPKRLFSSGRKYLKEGDKEKSFKYFKLAADMSNVEAQYRVGRFFLNGIGVTADVNEAKKYLKMAADAGFPDAHYLLGTCYDNENGLPVEDAKIAFEHFRAAALRGHPEAYCRMGTFYNEGWGGVKENQEEAVKYLKISAELNSMNGISNLGVHYENGWGVEKNIDLAIECYLKSANMGCEHAQYNLGMFYQTGPNKDVVKSFEYFKKSADQSSAKAQCKVAKCYFYGKGVSVNKTESYNYFKLAADQGHEEATNKLIELFSGDSMLPICL